MTTARQLLNALACAVTLATAGTAAAQSTAVYFNSQPGDYIGQGLQQTFTPPNWTFDVDRTSNGVHVRLTGSTWWDVYLVAPQAAVLTPGVYDGAERWPFQSPTRPGLSVSGNGRGCNTLTGRFVVFEATYGSSGEVLSFAADFEQHCEGGGPALFGAVRINSSVTIVPRLAVASASTFEGPAGTHAVNLSVFLTGPAATTVSVSYQTSDGTALAGSDYVAQSGSLTFTPGSVLQVVRVDVKGDSLPEATEFFFVDLDTPSGAAIAVSRSMVTILDDEGPATLLYLKSQPGDYVGHGIVQTLTPLDGMFTTTRQAGGVHVSFNGSTWWDVYLVPAQGQQLGPGVYEGATRWPFQSPSGPGLDASGDGRGCNVLSGRFVVLEAVYGPSGEVQSFAADFEQHCENAIPALFGSVRINSGVRVAPRLSVGNAMLYEGQFGVRQARFTASLSEPATETVTVDYATADGTASAGSDYVARSGTLTFAPGVTAQVVAVDVVGDMLPEGTEFFFLDLSAPSGAPLEFDRGTATLLSDEGPDTYFSFDSEPGDYIGQGRRYTRTPLDGTFMVFAKSGGVQVAYDSDTWWDFYFVPPSGAALTPGVYENAQRWPFQDPSRPGLSVSGDGRGCNILSGRFIVLEAVYGPSGEVQRFAADFEQHCEGGLQPALFGSIRYESLADPRAWAPVGAGDFDNDGFSDILWRHGGDGRLSVWLMSPGSTSHRATKPLAPWLLSDTNWRVVGVGDFSIDGRPDLLWRHVQSGKLVVWAMSDLLRTSGVFLNPSQMTDLNWQPVAVGDFNADGKADIVWQHTLSGRVAVWLMNGHDRLSGAFTDPSIVADAQWRIRGAADFDGDAKTDLLWQHATSGAIVVWHMDGLVRHAGVFASPDRWSDLDWGIAATGLFDLNAQRDVVWRNAVTNQVRVWRMNGVTRVDEIEPAFNEFAIR